MRARREAGLALQRRLRRLTSSTRIGRACGSASTAARSVLREIGGAGHVAYPMVGDTINTGARLESLAPVGGVLIGAETYGQLPEGSVVESRIGLSLKGKEGVVFAYVLRAVP